MQQDSLPEVSPYTELPGFDVALRLYLDIFSYIPYCFFFFKGFDFGIFDSLPVIFQVQVSTYTSKYVSV